MNELTSSRYAGWVVVLSAPGSVEVPRLGEMAETAALVWLRGPGFGCKAVWCSSAPCSVRDFICRHCKDQVRFVVPGKKRTEEVRGRNRCGEGVSGGVSILGVFQFLRLRVPQFQTDNEGFHRFCFVMVLSQRREKNPSAHRRYSPALSLD